MCVFFEGFEFLGTAWASSMGSGGKHESHIEESLHRAAQASDVSCPFYAVARGTLQASSHSCENLGSVEMPDFQCAPAGERCSSGAEAKASQKCNCEAAQTVEGSLYATQNQSQSQSQV